VQAWTWKGRECESQTPDIKKKKEKIALSFATSHKTQRNVVLLGMKISQKRFLWGRSRDAKRQNPQYLHFWKLPEEFSLLYFLMLPPKPAPIQITAFKSEHWQGLEVEAWSQTVILQLIFCQASYSTSETTLEDGKVAVRTMTESNKLFPSLWSFC